MIVLTNIENHRKFSITQENYEYLVRLLSHNVTYTTHQLLTYSNDLSYTDSQVIANNIQEIVSNNDIWEFLSENKVIPILNPKEETFIASLKPISKEHKWFLNKLSRFLLDADGIDVNHE